MGEINHTAPTATAGDGGLLEQFQQADWSMLPDRHKSLIADAIDVLTYLSQAPAVQAPAREEKPCHWGGGNDIIWCSTCGAEYAYAKGETRPECPRQMHPVPGAAHPKASRPVGEEAVDWHRLDDLFAKIPSGPWDAHRAGGGHEVRQLDTDPTNKHHWPFRLCQSVAGQRAQCDDAVFEFIAGVLNAWPQISTAVADAKVNRILGLSGDELRAEIIADGDDPDQMVADLDAKVSSTLEMFGRMQRAETALHQISSQYIDNRGDMTDAEALEAIAFLAKSAQFASSHPTTGQETVATPRDGGVREALASKARLLRNQIGKPNNDLTYTHNDMHRFAAELLEEIVALSAPGSARPGETYSDLTWNSPIILVTATDRGLAGQIMDAAWSEFGGNNLPAEFWSAFDLAIRFTLAATQSPAQEPTDRLVDRFADALKAKLRASEAKYGWRNGWLQQDWQADCRRDLALHVTKGDPLDVAAYAAFCWHHGWPTATPSPAQEPGTGDPGPADREGGR